MVPIRSILHTLLGAAQHRHEHTFTFPADWDEVAWTRFDAYARHHGLMPLLAHHFQAGRLHHVPAQGEAVFLKALHTCRLAHQCALRELRVVGDAFHESGIPLVPLKGPHLAEEAYATTGLRPFEDLDLLVEPKDLQRAEEILVDQGYRPPVRSMPSWLVHRYHFHTQWQHPDRRFCLELHWRPADTRRLRDTGAPTSHVRDLQEKPALMAVYLAVHLAKHSLLSAREWMRIDDPLLIFHPWSGIRRIWILDFQGLCTGRDLSAHQLEEAARRWHATEALAFLQHLTLISSPERAATAPSPSGPPPPSRSARRMLADLNKTHLPPTIPWWLRCHPVTGFRPIRLLDMFRT